jgi:putative hydrolase of the HAD superfamily
MIKAIFFDLYGTLINIRTDEYDDWVYDVLSRYLHYNAINIKANELKKEYLEGIQLLISRSKEEYPEVDVFSVFFNIINKYGKKKYSKVFVRSVSLLFRTLTIRNFSIFDGLYNVLFELNSRYKLGIISDAQWVFAEPEMSMLGLDQFFDNVILSSRYGFKKPDVRLFKMAMDNASSKPENSIYIGDNPYKDLIGAKRAGMRCILFRCECKQYNGYSPDACIGNYEELKEILNSWK